MFEIKRYTSDSQRAWNEYVAKARNATFLFMREYMDYHSDRFCDHSLMFFKDGKLYALLPAHVSGDVLCSHLGLTYGGLIMNMNVTIVETCELFAELNDYLSNRAGNRIVDFKQYANAQLNATVLIDTGCNADALVQYLSSKGIYVGLAHSACSADADYRVTQAFGISKETAERCIRVSFSEDNTFEDIDALVDGIKEFKEKFV